VSTFQQIVQYFWFGEEMKVINQAKHIEQLYDKETTYELDFEHIK
jgi:hypothetical protein